MALPDGMLSCTLTFGSSLTFDGTAVAMRVEVTPTHSLTWVATGQPIVDFTIERKAQAGMPGQFVVPVTDQPGFVDENGQPFTGWAYKVDVEWIAPDGEVRKKSKNVQPVTGQTSPIDIDLLPTGTITTPVSGTVPTVTSIAGLTGPVSAEQLADKLGGFELGGGGASGVFVVHYADDEWEHASLEDAVAAGLRETETLLFLGTATPPPWATAHPRGSAWFKG